MKRPANGTLFWIFQCGGWAAFGAVMFSWGLEYWSWPEALLNKMFLVLLGFSLTLILRGAYRRLHPRPVPPLIFGFVVVALSFAGALLWREAHEVLFGAASGILRGEAWNWTLVRVPLGLFLYDGFVLLTWSLLYNGIRTWMELEEQTRRAGRAEALAREARLRALQFQLEPHFLFNTLNAISTLVVEGSRPEATRMIARLSDFLRLTLESGDTPEISVARELEFVRGYLDIEQARFGDRLATSIEAGSEVMEGLVPALILQPLLENAVKHGVRQRDGCGRVTISVTRDGGVLRLAVTDNGPGLDENRGKRQGLGLANTAARLMELYGPASRFELVSKDGCGVSAAIEIPFRTTHPSGLP
ncbi:MAG TPA: histidine kinase [Vicinamibacteria bacterium]|nr:histidine kinase [Vicinamibacteria bacterium]